MLARLAADGSVAWSRVDRFAEVVAAAMGARLALVDIPIGLPDGRRIPSRACDRLARRLLGTRGASVFPPPVRAALTAPGYREAAAIQARLTGRGLTRQAWALAPRLREVLAALRGAPGLQDRLRETHPELCFWALAGGRPAVHPKRSRPGQAERLAVLARWLPGPALDAAWAAVRDLSGVRADDALDALAAAVTARAVALGLPALVLPPHPEHDPGGLRMEIVALAPGAAPLPCPPGR